MQLTPEQILEKKQLKEGVLNAIKNLPKLQAKAFMLIFI